MSNIYITEPPTSGKVLLHTSVGDIEIELWSKESPKASRNFVQLCMEGYYNRTVFHRLVPDFIVQGGDPTGTGEGGESIYGKPFRTEVHSRLRFNRRGLIAMSSTGPDDNRSQFFFTLGATPELERKHTIFGKVVGNTLYNMINLGNGEVDQNERPIHLHRIFKTEIISNPFPDIVPREVKSEADSNASKKQKSTARATKNFSLLSFGDEAEEEEEELTTARTEETFNPKKGKSSHDLLDDPRLSKDVVRVGKSDAKRKKELEEEIVRRKRKIAEEQAELERNRPVMLEDEVEEPVNKKKAVHEEIRELQRELAVERRRLKEQKEKKPDTAAETKEETVEENGSANQNELDPVAAFKAERDKFVRGGKEKKKKKKSQHEQATMQLFSDFLKKLRKPVGNEDEVKEETDEASNNRSYLTHRMKCEEEAPVLAMDANTAKDHERYDLYDPRNALNKRRREKK